MALQAEDAVATKAGARDGNAQRRLHSVHGRSPHKGVTNGEPVEQVKTLVVEVR